MTNTKKIALYAADGEKVRTKFLKILYSQGQDIFGMSLKDALVAMETEEWNSKFMQEVLSKKLEKRGAE
jgi:hypothetical protein|tara:strand:- start:306 stop:512 length:207 start_codon:yes stop_codon:yes gene_type:complete